MAKVNLKKEIEISIFINEEELELLRDLFDQLDINILEKNMGFGKKYAKDINIMTDDLLNELNDALERIKE